MYEEMVSVAKQSEKEKDNYTVTSPVTGYVEQFGGIYKGSNILSANMALRFRVAKGSVLLSPAPCIRILKF
jgi:hypothetical protein